MTHSLWYIMLADSYLNLTFIEASATCCQIKKGGMFLAPPSHSSFVERLQGLTNSVRKWLARSDRDILSLRWKAFSPTLTSTRVDVTHRAQMQLLAGAMYAILSMLVPKTIPRMKTFKCL